jgi:hypothetical protein
VGNPAVFHTWPLARAAPEAKEGIAMHNDAAIVSALFAERGIMVQRAAHPRPMIEESG